MQGDFYATLRPYTRKVGALRAIFNTQDEDLHKRLKSPIAPIFSLSRVTSFENLVDDVLECMSRNLDKRFVLQGRILDLGDWLQFFSFDVMGTMTFSKKYGFLDQGIDVDKRLDTIFRFSENAAPVSIPKFFTFLQ